MKDIIYSKKLSKFKKVTHGIATKKFGNMSFSKEYLGGKSVVNNRKRFLEKIGIDLSSIVNCEFTHSTNIHVVQSTDRSKGAFLKDTRIPNCDGLVTNIRNIFLLITVADCVPVLFYDPNRQVCGIIHTGWPGTLRRFAGEMIFKMEEVFECNPKDIIVFIGPAIGPCHFEVRDDVFIPFKKFFLNQNVAIEKDGKKFIDLWKANEIALLEKGILEQNIEILKECTYCDSDKYSSYRRDKENFEPMGAVIGMRK